MFVIVLVPDTKASSLVATSTAVERVFSQGRHLLHHTRNRLSPASIRAHLCLGSWGRHDLLLMDDQVAAVKPSMVKKRKIEVVDIASEDGE